MRGKKKDRKLPKGIFKRGKILWINYRDGSGNLVRESTEGESVADARALLEKKKTEIREGKMPILKKRERVKFNGFAADYLDECKGKKSFPFYERMIEQLKKFFGQYTLDQITIDLVKRYKRERGREHAHNREKRISPASVNRELAVLRNALNVAVENGKLQFNPMAGRSKLFAKENERQYIYSEKEIAALITEAPLYLKRFIIMALNTGCRFGEIAGLRWNEVNLDKRTITLTASRTKGNRTRTIPINEQIHIMLSELKLQKKDRDKGGEYVLPNPDTDKPFKWISHAWVELLQKCNIEINPPPPDPRPRFHDLRHSTATNWAAAGVPQSDIRDLLGHRYSSTTDRYMAGTDQRKREAVQRVSYGVPAGEVVELKKAK